MIKSTDFALIAPGPVTEDALVLVWMVESFYSGVALGALQSLFTLVPSHPLDQGVAVFCQVLEDVRGSPEVSGVVSINAAL
jgi:hypothetical protein